MRRVRCRHTLGVKSVILCSHGLNLVLLVYIVPDQAYVEMLRKIPFIILVVTESNVVRMMGIKYLPLLYKICWEGSAYNSRIVAILKKFMGQALTEYEAFDQCCCWMNANFV